MKQPPREKDTLSESDAESTLEFDPTALMTKGGKGDKKGGSQVERQFMYDESAVRRKFHPEFLKCPTIVVSMGLLNFEDSNYSEGVSKPVQKYLGHIPESYDRNDWNTILSNVHSKPTQIFSKH